MPVLKTLKNGVWQPVSGMSEHSHTQNDITDFPSSLPADGGNADTLDGKHADEFATKDDLANISGSWNDLTDKPFGEEQAFEPIYWDGSTEGRDVLDLSAIGYGVFYKVSDHAITLEELADMSTALGSRVFSYGFEFLRDGKWMQSLSYDHSHSWLVQDAAFFVHCGEESDISRAAFGLLLIYQAGEFNGVVVPSVGTYATFPFGDVSAFRMTRVPETIKPLDEKYLPESIATKTYVDEAVSNIPGGSGSSGSSEAIIDVVELPSEDIDESKFYRLLTGTFVYNQYPNNSWTSYCVESLPETGEEATNADMTKITAYYNVSDGELYGYVGSMLSYAFSIPAGWYPISSLFQVAQRPYSGIITDILDDPCDSTYRFLLEHVLYSYKEGKWTSHKTIGWAGDGKAAEVFNRPANKAYGLASHAEGRGTVAGIQGVESYGQHAEGHSTTASGEASHAEGNYSHAEGDSSHAEGYYSHAEGISSHAEGYYSHAEGNYSHAEGDSSHAEGEVSHAEGISSHAEGEVSHAEGRHTHAVGSSQHVQGEYNLTDPEYNPNTPGARAKYAHIVGNGTSGSNRSNAHTLDWEGNGWFAGTIKLGGTSQDDPEAKEIATKEYVQELLGVIENGTY